MFEQPTAGDILLRQRDFRAKSIEESHGNRMDDDCAVKFDIVFYDS